ARRHPRAERRSKPGEVADISNVDGKNQLRTRDDHRRLDALGNQLWHSDASFRQASGALSMLFAHVVPPAGGETEFADLRAAYDRLSRAMQAKIEGLVCKHSIFHSRGQLGHTDYTEAERAALPPAQHRLGRAHPGRKGETLYMGSHASHVVGWPLPDGRLLLRDLMEHATQREFIYRHSWRVGDLVIWDNRCTLHRGRPYDDAKHPRDLRRVTTRDPETALAPAAKHWALVLGGSTPTRGAAGGITAGWRTPWPGTPPPTEVSMGGDGGSWDPRQAGQRARSTSPPNAFTDHSKSSPVWPVADVACAS